MKRKETITIPTGEEPKGEWSGDYIKAPRKRWFKKYSWIYTGPLLTDHERIAELEKLVTTLFIRQMMLALTMLLVAVGLVIVAKT